MIKIRATVSILSSAVAIATVLSAPVVRASVTYTQPVATVLTAPVIQATLVDYTPFYDDYFVLDTPLKHVQPAYSDSSFTTDTINYVALQKVLTDAVYTTDSVTKFLLSPVDLNTATGEVDPDPASISETMAKVMSRPNVADTALTSDASAQHPQPAKSDISVATDAINSFNVGQVSTDTPSASEALAVNLSRPDVSDTSSASETTAKNVQSVRSDTASASEASAKSVGSVRSDAPSVSHTAPVFFVTSVQSDTPSASHSDPVFNMSKILQDTPGASDSLSYSLILGNVERVLNGPAFNRAAFN